VIDTTPGGINGFMTHRESPVPSGPMTSCPECRQDNAPSATFCAHCGTRIADADAPTVSIAQGERIRIQREQVSSSVHGRFLPGQRVGARYRIVGLLGRGGMGEVYRADDLELGQSVALKFLPERLAADDAAIERFRREVRTARQIAHPNVCRVYDISEVDGHMFLTMEYIDGEDLAHALRRMGRPSPEKAVELAREICRGLAAAHENGVLHRDLKPANIMIDGRGRARITDFGLAGLAEELQAANERAGTVQYMAPEQLAHGDVSVRSDIYSLGLILYELFTGRRAFEGESVEEIKRSRESAPSVSLSSAGESIDPAIERVVMRCLAPEPKDRPGSVYAVLGALPGGDPIAAALAAGETPSPELVANARDHGGIRPAVGVACVAVSVVLTLLIAALNARLNAYPELSAAALSVEAQRIAIALGYDDLPANDVGRFAAFADYQASRYAIPKAERTTIDQSGWTPAYVYWRRWSAAPLEAPVFHEPEKIWMFYPAQTSPGSVTVMLSSTGVLKGLYAVPEATISPTDEVAWSDLLVFADIDPGTATEIEPSIRPLQHCDELRAWRVDAADGSESRVAHAGSANGRIVYFETRSQEVASDRTILGPSATLLGGIGIYVALLTGGAILAWRNVRQRRCDLRSAFRLGLLSALIFAFIELLSISIVDQPFLWGLFDMVGEERGAHLMQHGLTVFVLYMAIEPYARRIWPRSLIGVVRSLSGKARDPLVGREILIGATFGIALGVIVRAQSMGGALLTLEPGVLLLDDPELASLSSVGRLLAVIAFALANSMLWVVVLMVILVVTRFLTPNNLTSAIVSAIVATVFYALFIVGQGAPLVMGVVTGVTYGFGTVWLVTRFGFLAGYVGAYTIMLVSFEELITIAPNAWYGPMAVPVFIAVLGPMVYGFVVALAGQPLFKDLLAEPAPAGA
jgi:serine/threonine-protein kinase